MGIETKSIGIMLDELISSCLKTWFSQEDLMNTNLSDEDRLKAAIKTQEYNNRRNQLIRAIDAYFGQTSTTYTDKTYAKHFGK
jgi:hypothetical protein